MTPKPSHTLPLAFLVLTILLALAVTQTLVRPVSGVPQAAVAPGSADASAVQAQPSAPQDSSDGQISLYEVSFDPLVTDLATTRGATESAVNADNQGLFLVQFTGSPDDAQMNALGPDVVYVQYVPENVFIVWSSPDSLRAADRNAHVRWTGSYYTQMRSSPDARTAAAKFDPAPVTIDATFIADGSLDQLADQIVANGGEVYYREPAAVMTESLAAERWRFTVDVDVLARIARWPSLLSLQLYERPLIGESNTNSFLADANQNPDEFPYSPWLADVGVDGTGVKVAILDTGIDWDHPDLNVTSGQELGGYSEHFRRDGVTPQEQPGSDGAPDESGHGTHVAGSVAGTGTTAVPGQSPLVRYGQGTAPGATLHAVDLLAPDAAFWTSQSNVHTAALAAGAALSNNSYGGEISRGYTASSVELDQVALDVDAGDTVRQPMLMVFIMHNYGRGVRELGWACSPTPPWLNIPQDTEYPCDRSHVAQAEAKNVLTVGALNGPHSSDPYDPAVVGDWFKHAVTLANFSSRGPAMDGRIKPDVVGAGHGIISTENRFVEAGGVRDASCADSSGLSELFAWCQGTSMAAPAVAGVAALFTQYWREVILAPDPDRDPLARPEPATVKAAIIVSADRIGNRLSANDGWGHLMREWPNGHEGWGRVNADRLLDPPVPVLYYENPQLLTDNGQSWTAQVRRASPSQAMKVVLVWSDAPGAAGANPALVNDLDLLVTKPGTDEDYCGNFFEPANQLWSQDCGGGTNKDSINNVEYVIVNPGSQGAFDIEVKATALRGNAWQGNDTITDQHFSLVCYNCVANEYYVDDSVDDGLVAYWKFDEGSGTTARNMVDQFGNQSVTLRNPTGRFTTAAVAPTQFRNFGALDVGTSLVFPSFDAGAEVPYSAAFEPQTELSIAMWVNPTFLNEGQNQAWLLIKDNAYGLSLHSKGQIRFFVKNSAQSELSVSGGEVRFAWTHIAATWHKDGYLRIYQDGRLVAQQLSDGQPLGTLQQSVQLGRSHKGWLDEVRFYDRRLTAAEVERLARGFECETSGTRWADAFHFVNCGTAAARGIDGAKVRVAQGIYRPGTSRLSRFFVDNVTVLGGFDGTDSNRRDWQFYPTILSGDLDRNESLVNPVPNGHNSHLVVQMRGAATLDGFTIQSGLADVPATADDRAAGIYSRSDETVTLRNLIVTGNKAALTGGGLLAEGKGTITLRQVKFLGNEAAFGGGAQIFTSSANMFNTIFSGNTATSSSGGASFAGDGTLNMLNSTFSGNTAPFAGGLRVEGSGGANIASSIFFGNTPTQIEIPATGVSVSESTVEGGFVGTGNLAGDPRFADPDGKDNKPGTRDDNLRLTRFSPAIDSATGCTSVDFIGAPHNLDGDFDGIPVCDRGAYEYGTLLLINLNPFTQRETPYLIDALQAVSIPYEVLQDHDGPSPSAEQLSGYSRVLAAHEVGVGWFSVSTWLDGGQRCLLESNNGFSGPFSPSPGSFYSKYFGLGSVVADTDYQQITGQGAFGGQAYGLSDPLRRADEDPNDQVLPDTGQTGVSTVFGPNAAIMKETSQYKTMLLGFPLHYVSDSQTRAAQDRGQLLSTFFNGCEPLYDPSDGALALSIDPVQDTYTNVFEILDFTLTIANAGTIPLAGPFKVDYSIGGFPQTLASCGSGPLSPGQTTSCEISYSTNQGDVSDGVVLAAGTASGNGVTAPEASATVSHTGPRISLKVDVDPPTFVKAGDKITFTYTIFSTGNETAQPNFSTFDDRGGGALCGNTALPVGQSHTCQHIHTVEQQDVDDGAFSTWAEAYGKNIQSSRVLVTVPRATAALSLDKTADRETYNAVGDKIVYTYKITNVGSGPMNGPFSVTDTVLGTIGRCGSGPLASGATTSCQKIHTVAQSDLDAGLITNTATASGNDRRSAPDTVTVRYESGTLILVKTADRQTFDKLGDKIVYTYEIRNAGTFTLAGPFTVTDDKAGTINRCGSGPLAPSAKTSCQKTYTVSQADIAAGSVTNAATASGNGATSSLAIVQVSLNGQLTLAKTADREFFDVVGDKIVYTYVISNKTAVTLPGPFTVEDDPLGTIDCGTGPLAPNATKTCTATHTVTQANVTNRSITNSAIAAGNGLFSTPVSLTVRLTGTTVDFEGFLPIAVRSPRNPNP